MADSPAKTNFFVILCHLYQDTTPSDVGQIWKPNNGSCMTWNLQVCVAWNLLIWIAWNRIHTNPKGVMARVTLSRGSKYMEFGGSK